jgi:hypothetical protein
MKASRKSVANQIVDFVQRRAERFNSEPYCVFEFIVQAGRLDGVRIKEYVKADKEDRGEHEEIK